MGVLLPVGNSMQTCDMCHHCQACALLRCFLFGSGLVSDFSYSMRANFVQGSEYTVYRFEAIPGSTSRRYIELHGTRIVVTTSG